MRKAKITIYLLICLLTSFYSVTANVFAEKPDPDQDLRSVLYSSGNAQTIHNPLDSMAGGKTDPHTLVGVLIKNIMGLAGTIGLVMFVWGGLLMMTAAGNKDQVGKGKETIVWAAIGIIVIFTSYALVSFILSIMSGS